MRLFCFGLTLAALLLVFGLVSVQPTMAQTASCRWDLDGFWVGERNGWRVNIKARAGGYVVWADGTPEPGQGVGEFLYRQTGPKHWTYTFPGGVKATMELDAKGLLQTVQPSGPETFKRVRPAGLPQCVGGSSAAPVAAPAQPGKAAQPLAGPAGNRLITGITHADMKEMIESEGHTASYLETFENDGGTRNLQATGTAPDGTRYVIFGKDCDHTGVPRCKRVQFMTIRTDNRLRAEHILAANSQHDAVTTAWFSMNGSYSASFSWQIPVEDGVPMRVLRSGLRAFLINQANAWNFIKGKLN